MARIIIQVKKRSEMVMRKLSRGGERSFGGNRWPRQETLALLQIWADMDIAFRDTNIKGPSWEEVSKKLAALGYHRSAKKCKKKFKNVYKYHRRTKEGPWVLFKLGSISQKQVISLMSLSRQPPIARCSRAFLPDLLFTILTQDLQHTVAFLPRTKTMADVDYTVTVGS
ncbi:hypothetical protein ACFX2H_038796 [Malus domestica]